MDVEPTQCSVGDANVPLRHSCRPNTDSLTGRDAITLDRFQRFLVPKKILIFAHLPGLVGLGTGETGRLPADLAAFTSPGHPGVGGQASELPLQAALVVPLERVQPELDSQDPSAGDRGAHIPVRRGAGRQHPLEVQTDIVHAHSP
jgi:hypothetical protein